MQHNYSNIQAIEWKNHHLLLMDQRVLPSRIEHLELITAGETANAIREMVVRGAPAIGITAAYGVVLSAIEHTEHSPENWLDLLNRDMDILADSRPTAVNLVWAIERMRKILSMADKDNVVESLLQEARTIHQEDIEANQRMGEMGADLIEQPCSVLTHCNAGALATGGYGTALGVIRSAFSRNLVDMVYADETRPWFQGSRLTAWELEQDHIPVKLITDSAAAWLMKNGKVGWVIVGSDRIASNGDVANKIGTYSAAVSARYHGVKFMVVAPSSTVDMSLASGEDIPIEMRDAGEILSYKQSRIAADGVDAWNPVFDVTPAELVDAIVTEKGVVRSPDLQKMQTMMASDPV